MALLGSGKGYSKKDINFFEEYTAAARKTARYLAYFIFAALVVIAIFVVWWLLEFISNNGIKKDISAMQARIEGDEFKDVEMNAATLESDLTKKNQQLYAMSCMRNSVDTTTVASSKLSDLLIKNIPTDTYISAYEITGDQFVIEGTSFTDYGAVNLVALLQDEENIFNTRIPTRIELSRENDVEVEAADGTFILIDVYYNFKITGSLTNNVNVSVSSYANVNDEVVALGAIQNYKFTYGETYENADALSTSYNGVEYTLTSIEVDGYQVSPEVLAEIMATGKHKIPNLTQNTEVTYYYSVAVAATDAEAGGEA